MSLSNDHTTLTRQIPDEYDKEKRIAMIWSAIHADTDGSDANAEALVGQTDQGSARTTLPSAGVWPDNELAMCRRMAQEGDVESIRRVAELLEVKEQDTEALVWWRRAAEAGDQDAVLYLKLIDEETSIE